MVMRAWIVRLPLALALLAAASPARADSALDQKKARYGQLDVRHTELIGLISGAQRDLDAARAAPSPDAAAISALESRLDQYANEQKQVYKEWIKLKREVAAAPDDAAPPAEAPPPDPGADAPAAGAGSPSDGGAAPVGGPQTRLDPATGAPGGGGVTRGAGPRAGSGEKAGNAAGVDSMGKDLKAAFADDGRVAAGAFPGGREPDGAAARALAGGAAAGPAGASGGPASPTTMRDFLYAAGPYRDAFKQAGLRVSTGPDGRIQVLRADGTPASPAELARLSRAIAAEPSALSRNPYYLDPGRGGISREDFADLKASYHERPELRDTEFKHIALPGDRDFKRSESCEVVSGDCNAHATKSYKKDDDVPPQDLKSIWDDIETSLKKSEDADKGAAKDDGLQRQRRVAGGLLSGLRSLASGLAGWLGGGDASPRGADGAVAASGAAPSPGAVPAKGARGPALAGPAARPAENGVRPPPGRWAAVLLFGAAVLFLAAVFQRRRSG